MSRNNYHDWLKLGACGLMVCDHLRFVSPIFALGIIPGRFAMPLFAVTAALHFRASSSREGYLRRLLPYALLSEPLFFFLTGCLGNVLLLFLFSFAFVHYGKFIFAVAACFCDYAAGGLVALVLFSMGGPPVPAVVFIGGLLLNGMPVALFSGACAMLPLVTLSVPPCAVGASFFMRGFYPLHLALLLAVKCVFFSSSEMPKPEVSLWTGKEVKYNAWNSCNWNAC